LRVDPQRDPFRVTFTRTAGQARRVVSWGTGQGNWAARLAATLVIVVLGLLTLLVMIPLLLLIALALLVFSTYLRLRFWWATRRGDKAATEGRENVRVIRRD
jgi:hypothetical protein